MAKTKKTTPVNSPLMIVELSGTGTENPKSSLKIDGSISAHSMRLTNELTVEGSAQLLDVRARSIETGNLTIANRLSVSDLSVENQMVVKGDLSVNNLHASLLHADFIVIPYGTPTVNTPGTPGQIMHDRTSIYIYTRRKANGTWTGRGQWERAMIGEFLDYPE